MANSTFNVGDKVRLSATAKQVSTATAVDPTAVFVVIETPAGVKTIYQYGVDAALIKSSVGSYYIDVDLSQRGVWHYRFYSTGTGQAAGDDKTLVASASRFS